MAFVVSENVAWVRQQKPAAHLLLRPLWFYDAPRAPQAKVFGDYQSFIQTQKGAPLVLANVTAYNPATDAPRAKQARVFSQPDVQVYTRTIQVAPFGAGSYATDVSHNTWSKVFDTYQEFPQAQKPALLILNGQGSLIQSSDIFHGQDTYGWPPDPVPSYWSPEMRGTRTILQNFVAYDVAHDVIGRQKQAQLFSDYAGYFTPQRITANAITVFRVYSPSTDVTRLKPQAKVFGEYTEYWNQAQRPSIFTVLPSPPPPPFLGPFAPVHLECYDVQPGAVTSTCELVWNASPGCSGYRIYVNGVPEPSFTTAQSATIAGLAINTSYLFNVVAVNLNGGDASALSNGILYEHGSNEFTVINLYPWGDSPEQGYEIRYPL